MYPFVEEIRLKRHHFVKECDLSQEDDILLSCSNSDTKKRITEISVKREFRVLGISIVNSVGHVRYITVACLQLAFLEDRQKEGGLDKLRKA